MDRQAKFIYVNNYASEMLGYSEHELLNMGVFDIDPFFAQEDWNSNWERRKNKTIPSDIKIESNQIKKDGSIIDVELISSYIKTG